MREDDPESSLSPSRRCSDDVNNPTQQDHQQPFRPTKRNPAQRYSLSSGSGHLLDEEEEEEEKTNGYDLEGGTFSPSMGGGGIGTGLLVSPGMRRRVRVGMIVLLLGMVISGGIYGSFRVSRFSAMEDGVGESLNKVLSPPADATTTSLEDDKIDNASTSYHIFKLSELPQHGDDFPTLKPTRFLPTERDCLELWFDKGEVCERDDQGVEGGDDQGPLGKEEQLDLVQLWVNGSDPLWRKGLELRSQEEFGHKMNGEKHYRDQGGLQYGLRSAVKNFWKDGTRESFIRKIHILTADMGCDEDEGCEGDDTRFGQIPTWMDKDEVDQQRETYKGLDGGDLTTQSPQIPQLQLHHHSEVYRFSERVFSSPSEPTLPWSNSTSWISSALPTFNSFSIESRIGWLDDLGDTVVQANDDMFFHRPLSTADFYSPLYGSMFRLDRQFGLQVKPVMEPYRIADSGEWGGLQHANWLLSEWSFSI